MIGPYEIQMRLKDAGSSQRKLANKIGVSPPAVSQVVHRARVSDKIMRAIADTIGIDYRKVFPEYYLAPPKRKTSKAVGRL